ncbi:MAG TPA: NAD(P)-dependent oxidoreductase [Puia sp.]|jgi:3-hydroxyisobutyrate dehydrogenase|nr:NAD(P)-dependent oxidoreductase [Puia sp.]
MKIGWIGLGNMGSPMSQRLINAGYPVTVYNRNKAKEEPLKLIGVTVASSPRLLLEQVDIVIIMVTDDQAIRQVFTGDNGLLGTKTIGKIIINMSTVSPGISKEMASLCSQEGNHYLDAPVSGSVKQAEEGQLVIMVGGNDTILEKAKPIFEHLGKLILHVGGTGAGNTAKLAINILLAFHAQGLAEAVIFARQNEIKTEDLITLINNSALGNVFTKIKGDAIIQNNYRAAFALKHIAKDLRLAKEEGLATPMGETTFKTFQQAKPVLGEEDIIAVIKYISPHSYDALPT